MHDWKEGDKAHLASVDGPLVTLVESFTDNNHAVWKVEFESGNQEDWYAHALVKPVPPRLIKPGDRVRVGPPEAPISYGIARYSGRPGPTSPIQWMVQYDDGTHKWWAESDLSLVVDSPRELVAREYAEAREELPWEPSPGDLVELKSGSPPMTVTSIMPTSSLDLVNVYFWNPNTSMPVYSVIPLYAFQPYRRPEPTSPPPPADVTSDQGERLPTLDDLFPNMRILSR